MREKYLKLIIKESLLSSLINAITGNKKQKTYTSSTYDSNSGGYGGGYGGFDIHDYDHYSTHSHSLTNSEKEELSDILSKDNTDQDTVDDSDGDD